ncbi:MAG: tetratricopeptide repeat protein [Campylobacterales bacterium]
MWALAALCAFAQAPDPLALQARAEGGDIQAQFDLGFLYGQGAGVEQNASLAKTWWLKAAESGHGGAQTNLGVLLLSEGNGSGAFYWLRQAADQNGSLAKCHLAELYATGTGTQKNLLTAKTLALEGFTAGAKRCQSIWYLYGLEQVKAAE